MRIVPISLVTLLAAPASLVLAHDADPRVYGGGKSHKKSDEMPEQTKAADREDADKAEGRSPGADNTGINKRDREEQEKTAQDQGDAKSDVRLVAKIRRALIKDKTLSVNAHNVKVIAQNGLVTLKGPVRSEKEKFAIENRVAEIAGAANITSELEVNQ